MSEIASKPNSRAGSSLAPLVAKKGAATEHDVMFAALFGGATGDISADDDNRNAVVLAGVFAVQTTEQDDPENPPQEALLETIAALQAVKSFDQKQSSKVNHVALENSEADSADENSDALVDMIAAVPLGSHIDPIKGNTAGGTVAKGSIADPLQNTKSIRASMAFEDAKSSGQATANLPKIGLKAFKKKRKNKGKPWKINGKPGKTKETPLKTLDFAD